MALTYSPSAETTLTWTDFQLEDVFGNTFDSKKINAPVRVPLFICGHCPYVQAIEDRIVSLAKEFDSKKVQFIGICSNDGSDYPEDRPEALKLRYEEKGYSFPYLIDESQQVAKSYGAVCTPDIFVFKDNQLQYRGRLDDSWKDPSKVEKQELRSALLKLSKNEKITDEPIPSMGCSIKWK